MAVVYESAPPWELHADRATRSGFPAARVARAGPVWLAAALAAAPAAALLLLTTLRLGAPGGLAGALPFACHALGVFLCCFALLRIVVRLSAVEDAAALAVDAVLLGVAFLVGGVAFVSGGMILGGAFSMMQLAVAVVSLALALGLCGSVGSAVALLGVVCDLRPEVALWGVFALAGLSVAQAWEGGPGGVPIRRAWLLGGGCALALAMPAILGLGHAGMRLDHAGLVPPGGLAAVRHWHWPVWWVPLHNWVQGISAMVLGLAAFSGLGADARIARGAFLGVLAVFLLGCVAPLLGTAQWLLGPQPLAADRLLQLLAAAAAAAVVVRDLRGSGGMLRVVLSVLIAAGLLLHPVLLPLAALAMLARAAAAHGELLGIERRIRDPDRVLVARAALGAVLLAAVIGGLLQSGLLQP